MDSRDCHILQVSSKTWLLRSNATKCVLLKSRIVYTLIAYNLHVVEGQEHLPIEASKDLKHRKIVQILYNPKGQPKAEQYQTSCFQLYIDIVTLYQCIFHYANSRIR